MFNFSEKIEGNQDVVTTYKGKKLILKNVYYYKGPVTMQYLPYGGIQSTFNKTIIINSKYGFIGCDEVIYDNKKDYLDNPYASSTLTLYNSYAFKKLLIATNENEISQQTATKIGRNDTCPCGSGLKYKKCCGQTTQI